MTKQSSEQDYWLKAKRYGWGWGFPRRWQGWAVFVVFVAIWATALVWLQSIMRTAESYTAAAMVFAGVLLADIIMLLYFSFKYGDSPKWRRGKHK